ncbi:MarR family winged helix-turn-helix transcriptional regulator [Hyphococcus sp.]|uniref:MarR family winged helix-turn-helix transcriptional regulator n=1 Tax=Hyphococcus sp. TaxID=2038636 RepID=UPI003D0D30B9
MTKRNQNKRKAQSVIDEHQEGELDDIGEIDDIVGFHIRLAYTSVYRHFMDTFSDLDMTQKQVSVLWLVDDHPGIAQTDLAKRLRMDRATVMAIINRLEGRRLLRRGQSASDGRKQTLKLTPTGQKVLIDAKKAVHEHEEWLKQRFTKQEVRTLIEYLRRIHD